MDLITKNNVAVIGAVLAVLMLYATHFPRERITIFFVVTLEIRWLVVLYSIYDLHPVLLALAGDQVFTGIANAAHLGGLAFGFFYARQQWRFEPTYEQITNRFCGLQTRTRQMQRRFKVVSDSHEPPEMLEDRVDEILLKLHNEGDTSLTAAERTILQAASERYRRRRDQSS